MFSGTEFGLTNVIDIQVGEQVPYEYNPVNIPGIIEPGKFDAFEGGVGQNISYYDNTQANQGTYRVEEFVDVEYSGDAEGPTLGWIEAGEWVEHSIIVAEPGYYNLEYRYASDIPSGGGPFFLDINGIQVSNDIYVDYTGDWYNWTSEIISDIELNSGEHVLRIFFEDGGFNLGRMTFTLDRPLDYNPPIANAGDDIIVLFPDTNALLDASESSDADNDLLNFHWEQVYGPNIVIFSNENNIQLIYDLVGILIVFFLIFLFKRLKENLPKLSVNTHLDRFINYKCLISLLLIPTLTIMCILSFADWFNGLFLDKYVDDELNYLFFVDFFSLLILVDVFILLISFQYTERYSQLIRNTGFIISTS